MQIKLSSFGGENPKTSARLLPDAQSSYALDCDLLSGAIKSIKADKLGSSLPDSTISIYNYDWNGSTNWLSWTDFTRVAKSTVADDTYNRIYYTSISQQKTRFVNYRQNDSYYLAGTYVRWGSTPETLWTSSASAGKTAATAPSITGIAVGGTVTDGQITWTRVADSTSIESEYNIGVPAPTGKITATTADKLATSWSKTWRYFYEEPDGTKVGDAALSATPTETSPGATYTLPSASVPAAPSGASASAFFVMYLQATSSTGSILGRVYPDISAQEVNSDLYISGSKVTATQTTSGDRVMSLSYDTSENSEYVADRSYVYTFVNAIGEEGPPSEPSSIISVAPNQDAILSGMDESQPSGGYTPITRKRIYRTVTSSVGTEYQLVAEIDLAARPHNSAVAYLAGEVVTASGNKYICISAAAIGTAISAANWVLLSTGQFRDFFTDAEVSEVIPSSTWAPPVSGIRGIAAMPGSFLAAFKGQTVYFSEVNQASSWPLEYAVTIEDDIVGLAVSTNTLVVLTNRYPYLITAQAPDQASVSKLSAPQSCVSECSITENGGAVIYASPDGICLISGAAVVVISENAFSKEQWESYRTSSGSIDDTRTLTFVYDDYIYVATVNKVFRFRSGDQQTAIIEKSGSVYGTYDDRDSDEMYLIKAGTPTTSRSAYLLMRDSSVAALAWTSKIFQFPLPIKFCVARVTASAYPITLRIYTNESLASTISVTSAAAFRLPKIDRNKVWSFSLSSSASTSIYEVVLAGGFIEL